MMILLIKGKKVIQKYHALCEKVIAPLVNHKLTAINYHFWKVQFP